MTMPSVFNQTPGEYRAESARVSPLWRIVAPIAFPIVLGVIAYIDHDWYYRYLQDETGLLEFLHMLLPFLTALIAARLLLMPWIRRDPLIAVWLAAMVVGGIYLGGEEASWGQHYFGWRTPEHWAEINGQRETNLHNSSIWFDKVPRLVVVLGVIVGGLVLPMVRLRWPRLISDRLAFVIPPAALSVLSGVMLAGEVIGEVRERTDALEGMLRFRPQGEMQENFITAFMFFYAVFLWKRAWQAVPAHAGEPGSTLKADKGYSPARE